MRFSAFFFAIVFALAGCGGGSGSSNNGGAQSVSVPQVGSITILVGDAPLDGIDQVLIDIREIRLLGDDGQVTITDGAPGVIDLLSLRNLTELIASDEVPAGDYSKIRVLIDSLQVVETDNPVPVEVQLPANGKIDLNPQGAFEISPGEDLVVQIDFDLARSIKIVQTGNSQYRFRPVVFIDVLDQTDNLRLTRLFGSLEEDNDSGDDPDGEVSDYDLCGALDSDSTACVDIEVDGNTLYLSAEGNEIEQVDVLVSVDAHVFGHFDSYATVDDRDGDGKFLRAKIIVLGNEDSLVTRDGDVASAVSGAAFDLTVDDATSLSVNLADYTLLLDEIGQPLLIDIAAGQEAEAWAQSVNVEAADDGVFPAFLVQVREGEVDGDSVEGQLTDLNNGVLTVLNDGLENCVVVGEDTEIQLLSNYEGDAEIDVVSLIALGDLISVGVEVEVFGIQNGDCLDAEVVVAEVD